MTFSLKSFYMEPAILADMDSKEDDEDFLNFIPLKRGRKAKLPESAKSCNITHNKFSKPKRGSFKKQKTRKTKLKESHVNGSLDVAVLCSKNALEFKSDTFCPSCQLPFNALKKQSHGDHVNDCLNINFDTLPACLNGLECDDMTISHYRMYNHRTLAQFRSGCLVSDAAEAAEDTDSNTEVDNAKRKLSFSSSKKYITKAALLNNVTVSNVSQTKTPDVALCDSLHNRDPSETPIDQAKKKLSFSAKKDCLDSIERVGSEYDTSENSRSKNSTDLVCEPCPQYPQGHIENEASAYACLSDDDLFASSGEESSEKFYDCVNSVDADDSGQDNLLSQESKEKDCEAENVFVNCFSDLPENAFEEDILETTDYSPNSSIETRITQIDERKANIHGKTAVKTATSQASITSFFRSTLSEKVTHKPNHCHSSTFNQIDNESKTSNAIKPLSMTPLKPPEKRSPQPRQVVTRNAKVPKPGTSSETNTGIDATSENETNKSFQRKCPFYKKMPGTPFTVDAFRYGVIPDCKAYFLTHFHYDHYCGLRKSFAQPIYCSKVTANLVEKKIRVDRKYLNTLPLNEPTLIHGVQVTLMDANHCPGAVLILFRLADGRTYLHTGDFRASTAMQEYAPLRGVRISQLYLDTTYCDPQYAFPPQDDVINFAVSTTHAFLRHHPNALVVVGSYTIGKERLFMAIAQALQSKVCVTREKKQILDCLEDDVIDHHVTLSANEARVHVVPMNQLNQQSLQAYLEAQRGRHDSLLAFEPTGWTHNTRLPSLQNTRPKWTRDNVVLYGVPYSEHSSFTELRDFCQFVRPDKILPTVNNGNAQARHKMEQVFASWRTEKTRGSRQAKQASLKGWVKGKT